MPFNHKKERGPDTTMWMSPEYVTQHEISQSQKDNTVLFHSHEVSRMGKFLEVESRLEATRAEERGPWGVIA